MVRERERLVPTAFEAGRCSLRVELRAPGRAVQAVLDVVERFRVGGLADQLV